MAAQTARLSISVPKELKVIADTIAREQKITRSQVVSNCLKELAEKRKIALMEEGYKTMANEQRQFAKMSFELQRRAVPDWE